LANVATWHLFAYFNRDEERDEHRTLADWQVEDALRWCRTRGYDNILLTRVGETEFHRAPQSGLVHSSHTAG
jgi:hypothetical protein